jgi:hypothetical protein
MRAIARCLLAMPAIVMLLSQGVDPSAAQTREIPKFEVDPSWPKLPSKYVWGQVSSVSIDDRGHAWILQRPTTVRADQRDKAAPPVLEFDEAGNFIHAWAARQANQGRRRDALSRRNFGHLHDAGWCGRHRPAEPVSAGSASGC